jgi:hypothetical protein
VTTVGGAFGNLNTVAQAQSLSAAPERVSFVTEVAGSQITCRKATREEALALTKRDGVERRVISPASHASSNGLKIILRATPQLDSFPKAKAAFLAAAARWESLISTPITIVIDVDFGPTFFGQPFPPLVLGSTDTILFVRVWCLARQTRGKGCFTLNSQLAVLRPTSAKRIS